MKGPCKTPGCASHAINPHRHGREPDVDLDLCDVCYWRKRAVDWRKWPGEKPKNDDPIERIALSDEGKIYLTKTPPSQWCKGNSFHWAEIPRPEGE
jgi:hypothetical protein